MDSSTIIISIYVILQLILAPMLYPYGYLLEFLVILLVAYQNRYLREIELQLLEPLILVFLLTNMTLSTEQMSTSGYAVRIMLIIIMCYHSQRLQNLSNRLISPVISCLLFVELVAVKQLYPFGYLSQLLLIYFLYYHNYNPSAQRKANRSRSGELNFLDEGPIKGLSSPTFLSASLSFEVCSLLFILLRLNLIFCFPYQSVEENWICKICFERFVDTTFASCGHCCCRDCARSLSEKSTTRSLDLRSKCPFCQMSVSQKIELFFP